MKPFVNCPFDIEPFDESRLIKNPNLVNLNYTNQDFASLKTRLIEFIKEKFTEDFNDLVEGELAIMLIENWAFVGDTLSFKIDQVANEVFIDTVTEVDNAFRLAQLVGFRPQPPISSRSFWSATITNTTFADVIIDTPVTSEFSTEDGLKNVELYPMDQDNQPIFNEPIIIPAGSFSNTNIIGLEGRTRTDFFRGTGEVNQFFQLGFGPVIDRSVQVSVDGVQWTEVDYFTDSQPRREYRVEFDADYNAFIIFGNNRAGLIPSPESDIQAVYRTGGGVAGNIVTGALNFSRSVEIAGIGFRLPVTFTNITQGEFGFSGDTLEDIRRKLPPYLRTQDRAVTGDDYETLAGQFVTPFSGQVGKAKAVLTLHGCAANLINLFILAKNGTDGLQKANNELKSQLYAELEIKKMFTDTVCIRDGNIIEVDVSIDVTMDKFYRKFEDEFRVGIESRTNTFFSLNNWEFGLDLKDVDLIKDLSDIREIRNAEITFTTQDPNNSGTIVNAKYFEIIRPANISINFIFE